MWRAEIVLLMSDGVGTNEIMRRPRTLRMAMAEALYARRSGGTAPRQPDRADRAFGFHSDRTVVARTLEDPPDETTHWTALMMTPEVRSASVQCCGSGGPIACNPTAFTSSSSRTIQSLSRSFAMSSGYMSRHLLTRLCCRSTKIARSRRFQRAYAHLAIGCDGWSRAVYVVIVR
jgi:hypothetical protein